MRPARNKILFVEDHEDTRELMVLVLRDANYDVLTSPTLAGALTLAESVKFDLFMLDSLLLDGTGIELCKRIRLIDPFTPILFCSALAYESDKAEAFNSGAQSYLVKPIDISLLCRTVAELITRPNGSDGHRDGDRNGNGSRKKALAQGQSSTLL
jgi:two-component system, OmpR family, alkaline phosphatase synthesis response regulator PhoP